MISRLVMVSAESIKDGFAPHAHTQGLTQALKRLGYSVNLVGEDSGNYFDASVMQRLWRYVVINWRAISSFKSSDILFARSHFAHYPWVMMAHILGKPVVHEMNGLTYDVTTSHPWLARLQRLITGSYRAQFLKASGIICVTEEIAQSVRQLGVTRPIIVLNNGVDAELFFPAEETTKTSSRRFAIFPSALTSWHGVSTLLSAVDHPRWPSELDLVIVGNGTKAQAVKERASRGERVRHYDVMPHSDLAALMRQATIGLSIIEAPEERGVTEVYPLKVFEMMASGLPLVATALPGQKDLILAANAGIIVPPHDAEAVAKAVSHLLSSKDRTTMGTAARESILQGHSWNHRAAQLKPFLQEILAAKNKAASGNRPQ